MIKIISLFALIVLFGGCSSNYGEKAVGLESVWCNDRYLPIINAKNPVATRDELVLAQKGYIYSLLSTYVLQGKNSSEDKDHMFSLPERIKRKNILQKEGVDKSSGFEVTTFEIFNSDGELSEVAIAFTGTNNFPDWKANFLLSKKQYIEAAEYIIALSNTQKYKDIKFVVTGDSLGGGLAAHVTKNPITSNLIKEAWVFNSSPVIWADSNTDTRIWQAASRSDILKFARWEVFRILPGVARIGAPENQTQEDFYLIQSDNVYAHFRWVLTRNLLHLADLKFYLDSNGSSVTSEPLEILKMSHAAACPQANTVATKTASQR